MGARRYRGRYRPGRTSRVELARIVELQARDAAQDGRRTRPLRAARGHVKLLREADLPDDGSGGLDDIADRDLSPLAALIADEAEQSTLAISARHLIGVGRAWDVAVVNYDPQAGPCPACGDARLRKVECCLVCAASGEEPGQHPMQLPERGAGWDGSAYPLPVAGGLGTLDPVQVAKVRAGLRARARALRRARDGRGQRPAA